MFNIIFILISGALGLCSFIMTAYIKINFPVKWDIIEKTFYSFDNILINLLLICLVVLFLYFCRKIFVKINKKIMIICMIITTALIGGYLIYNFAPTPRADMQALYSTAQDSIKGDFKQLRSTEYIGQYPYQIGYTLIIEIMLRLFGDGHVKLIILNLLSILFTYYLMYKIVDIMFKNDNITKLTIIIMGMFVQLFMYILMIYGNLIGLTFALLSIYLSLKFFEDKKAYQVIFSALAIAIAVQCKSNYLIFAVAEIIMYSLYMFREKKLNGLFFILLFIVFNKFIYCSIESYYEIRSGINLGKGIPKTAWLNMGLNNPESMAPGWYDGSSVSLYKENNHNTYATNKVAEKLIVNKIKDMPTNKKYWVEFFTKKTISQWCNPTYQSLWISQPLFDQNDINTLRNNKVLNSLYYRRLNSWYCTYCDIITIIIFGFSAFAYIVRFKDIGYKQNVLAIGFMGGVAFHMLFEAKATYALQYVFVLIPYAAVGIEYIFNKQKKLLTLTEQNNRTNNEKNNQNRN